MTPGINSSLQITWLQDADIIALLANTPLCRSLFGQPELLIELQQLLQSKPEHAQWYRPACISLGNQKIGAGGFKGPPISGGGELGYRVHPDYRLQGHATALVRWLCDVAGQHSLSRVYAVTVTSNRASQSVLAGAGFVHTGDFLSDSQQWLQRWQHTL